MATPESKPPMIGWYDPQQLLQTAKQVVISGILGRHADRRLIEDLATQAYLYDCSAAAPEEEMPGDLKRNPIEIADADKELWIDYVSDVGDGWNSTYAVAHHLSQPQLQVKSPDGATHVTQRGRILIFGGDEVYPTATREFYRERWEQPYREALSHEPQTPHFAFAVPGNHDWYDSLASFSEIFSGWFVRRFAEHRRPPQNRSYFALRLPHHWWLLGVDVQLEHDLDEPQLKYFEYAAELIKRDGDEARVILCCAEPFWVYADVYGDAEYRKSRLYRLINETLGEERVKVYLAGDLHHYYRVRDARDGAAGDGILRITAGGGGAFLHPTHGEVGRAFEDDSRYSIACYPERATSQRLGLRNIKFWSRAGFLWQNRRFGLVTATLYLLTAWFMMAGIGERGRAKLYAAAMGIGGMPENLWLGAWVACKAAWGGALLNNPFLVFLSLAVIGGFIAFTDSASKWYNRIAGTIHAVLHLGAAGFIGWLGYVVQANVQTLVGDALPAWPIALSVGAAAIFSGGWVVGSCIMATYLYVSLNWAGRHSNEGFSSLRIEDWKNFLRLKFDAQGGLTIYPLGLDRVPRWSRKEAKNEWREQPPTAAAPSRYVPQHPNDERSKPRLIEAPLHYPAQ